MKKNIFITGANGFLGSHIMQQILKNRKDYNLYLLIRKNKFLNAEKRFYVFLKYFYGKDYSLDLLRRIRIIEGDLYEDDLGIRRSDFNALYNKINEIYHCAANIGFRVPLDDARRINVVGTKNILEFSKKLKKLKKINYISTVFIAGEDRCIFDDNKKIESLSRCFNNTYEQSKYEAELLIKKYKNAGLSITIFRPSILAGEYLSGRTTNFQMFYEFLHFFSLELFKNVPLDVNVEHNMIAVDIAAKAIFYLAENETQENVYHIINPNNGLFLNFLKKASNFFGYCNPKFIPLKKFRFNRLTIIQKKILEPFIPYFNYKVLFKASKTEAKLKQVNFSYPVMSEDFYCRLFAFCKMSGFIKCKNNE
jgi:thioester reductase-like protein